MALTACPVAGAPAGRSGVFLPAAVVAAGYIF
jgi:hypothetical protein